MTSQRADAVGGRVAIATPERCRRRHQDWLRRHTSIAGRTATVLFAVPHRDAGAMIDTDVTTFAGYLHDVGKSPLIVDDRRQPVHTVLDPDLWPRTFEEKAVYLADPPGCQFAATLTIQNEVLAALPFGPDSLAGLA